MYEEENMRFDTYCRTHEEYHVTDEEWKAAMAAADGDEDDAINLLIESGVESTNVDVSEFFAEVMYD
jgi:hypothetical protein